jgi:RimJ/RimL family protein N-acetyltransferase
VQRSGFGFTFEGIFRNHQIVKGRREGVVFFAFILSTPTAA